MGHHVRMTSRLGARWIALIVILTATTWAAYILSPSLSASMGPRGKVVCGRVGLVALTGDTGVKVDGFNVPASALNQWHRDCVSEARAGAKPAVVPGLVLLGSAAWMIRGRRLH